jgi:hypothetical protein
MFRRARRIVFNAIAIEYPTAVHTHDSAASLAHCQTKGEYQSMWRLLPLILLVGCTTDAPIDSIDAHDAADNQRVVSVRDMVLEPASQSSVDQGLTKTFRQGETRGWISENGAWAISSAVTHTRLRCATYEVGIQLGQGAPDCNAVRWLTNVQYGTRQEHCNSATRVHRGGGTLPDGSRLFETSTCVRVVTRCSGVC